MRFQEEGTDYLVRATAAGGQVRAFAATTRNTVEQARKAHNTSPVATAALGRLLTGGAMMGAMMKGDKRATTPQPIQVAVPQMSLEATSCQGRTGRVKMR